MRVSSPDEQMAKSLEEILAVDPTYDGKKARFMARETHEKQDSEVDDKALVKKPAPAESGSIVSPIDPPSHPDPLAAESARIPSPSAQQSPIKPSPSTDQSEREEPTPSMQQSRQAQSEQQTSTGQQGQSQQQQQQGHSPPVQSEQQESPRTPDRSFQSEQQQSTQLSGQQTQDEAGVGLEHGMYFFPNVILFPTGFSAISF